MLQKYVSRKIYAAHSRIAQRHFAQRQTAQRRFAHSRIAQGHSAQRRFAQSHFAQGYQLTTKYTVFYRLLSVRPSSAAVWKLKQTLL